jgi:hypothetical protein
MRESFFLRLTQGETPGPARMGVSHQETERQIPITHQDVKRHAGSECEGKGEKEGGIVEWP